MNRGIKNKCHTIIHTAAIASAGGAAGLSQLPCSDSAVLIPIQLGMIVSLASVFGIKLEQAVAKSILATQIATLSGRAFSQVLVGWVPIAGNTLNAITACVITESIGWAVVGDFSREEGNYGHYKLTGY